MSLQSLNRSRLRLGREMLKAYPEWRKTRDTLDRWIEGIISSPGLSENGRVMGGLPKYVQERLLERKEADPYYQRLVSDIALIDTVVESLSDEKKFLVEMFHWRGREWWELKQVLAVSRTTLYAWIEEIDGAVLMQWERSCEGK